MRNGNKPLGFTLVEVMVILALSSALLMTIAVMFSALLKAQRQFSLRERQRREVTRIDALLRSDAHAAIVAIASDPDACELKGRAGETWTYRRDEDNLVRIRSSAGAAVQRESFRLQPGTKLEFRVLTEQDRSWLEVELNPPPRTTVPALAPAVPYRARLLVGGLVVRSLEKSQEKSP